MRHWDFLLRHAKGYQAIITPIDIAGERLGTLFIYKVDEASMRLMISFSASMEQQL